jgi:hypothetical protein
MPHDLGIGLGIVREPRSVTVDLEQASGVTRSVVSRW